MKVTKYYCDHCGEEKNQNDLMNLAIGVQEGDIFNYYIRPKKELLLCEKCLKKVGIAIEDEKGKTIPNPDIKDRLFDIMVELISTINQE